MPGTLSTAANVTDFLLDGKHPGRVALRMLDGEHTYGDLQAASERMARYLCAGGLQKGDRVLLLSGNSFFWVACYLGALRAGMVCVPVSTTIQPQDLEHILKSAEARVAFVQSKLLTRYGNLFGGIDVVSDRGVAGLPAGNSHRTFEAACAEGEAQNVPLPSISPDDLAALMFTSGSTGKPRGVMISHRNIIANTGSIVEYLKLTEQDRGMTVLPFHYCFGTSLLHTHLRAGASLVVDGRFLYPDTVLQRMIETECTGFAGVPSHFQILLRNSSLKKKSFPKLRYVQQAGGPLAPCFIRDLRAALPGTQIFIMYGQTEATARLSYLPPEWLDAKMGSIGRGIPGVRLRVVDEAGQDVGVGEIGEIVAQGENIALGYWRTPSEAASPFGQGRLSTGDLARIDEEGFIYIVDRAKDILKCGGVRISCRQLEEKLLEFEGLLEAAVIGIPDEVLGEAVKAYVVPSDKKNDSLAERLQLFCREHLPHNLVPRAIEVLPTLPKNEAGKVLKQALRQR